MLLDSSAMKLSAYIISFAQAAKTAQSIMTSYEDPMVIKEFRFKVNITADMEFNSETDIELNIWKINAKQKLSIGYKESIGLEVECVIQPSWVISLGGQNGN